MCTTDCITNFFVLLQSLTESDTSDSANVSSDVSSHDSPANNFAASQSALSDDKYWWDTQSGSDEGSGIQQNEFKDGSTWLKSNAKLDGSSSAVFQNEKPVKGHSVQPVHTSAGDTRQPITVPVALSTSDSSSSRRSSEKFTHDSLGMSNHFIILYGVGVLYTIKWLLQSWFLR